MEDIKSYNTLFFCNICKTKPENISEHKKHLKSLKHIFKVKCFEQCINMTLLHSQTSNIEDLIKTFQQETGLKYSENIEKFGCWRLKFMSNLYNLIKEEYPDVILIKNISYNFTSKKEFCEKIVEENIKANETILINE
jgi:hypothetical protein